MNHLEAKAIVSTTAMQIAASFAMMAMASVAPLVAADIGVPASMIGSYIGVLYVGSAIAACTCGPLLARHGAIRITQVALGFIASGILIGCYPLLLAVAFGAFLLGMGYGWMTPSSSDLLSRYTAPQRMGLVFSVKQTGVPLGFALAGLVIPYLSQTYGWKTAMGVVAASCVLLILAAIPVREELDSYRCKTAKFSLTSVFASLVLVAKTPALRLATMISFVYNGMQLCVLSFLVSFFVEARHFDLLTAGLLLSTVNAGGMFGRPFWGWVSDLIGNPKFVLGITGGIAASIVFTMIYLPQAPLVVYLALCAILGATSIGWNGVALALMAKGAPQGKAGAATGGSLFYAFFGSVSFPTLFGFIERSSSYEMGYTFMAAVSGSTALFLLLTTLFKKKSR